MNQRLLPIAVATTFAAMTSLSCASKPAVFETVTSKEAPEDDDPPGHFEPQRANMPQSVSALEDLTGRFVLAVENNSVEQLREVLTPDAVVRRHPSGAGLSAVGELQNVAAYWAPASTPGAPDRSPAFGPARLIKLDTESWPATATLEVDGPLKVRGNWKLRFSHSATPPRIAEVVLPKTR